MGFEVPLPSAVEHVVGAAHRLVGSLQIVDGDVRPQSGDVALPEVHAGFDPRGNSIERSCMPLRGEAADWVNIVQALDRQGRQGVALPVSDEFTDVEILGLGSQREPIRRSLGTAEKELEGAVSANAQLVKRQFGQDLRLAEHELAVLYGEEKFLHAPDIACDAVFAGRIDDGAVIVVVDVGGAEWSGVVADAEERWPRGVRELDVNLVREMGQSADVAVSLGSKTWICRKPFTRDLLSDNPDAIREVRPGGVKVLQRFTHASSDPLLMF